VVGITPVLSPSAASPPSRQLATRGEYGLVRHDGFLMHFPGKNFMLANVTHLETSLDPLAAASMVSEGRRQADNVIRFLKAELPLIFGNARIRTYGNPGLGQTRWIVGRRQLTMDDIRSEERPADAAARCAWWVELHNAKDLVHWERFEQGHVYYIPLACMLPKGADNVVAAGRWWTRTSLRCRPSGSWDRASRWARQPRTRSTLRARVPCTRSI
jgi:FAD-dependent oxidoreductase family protein